MEVKVETSARHVHLSKKDFIVLFGADAVLKNLRDLSVIGEFLGDKRVTLVGSKNSLSNVSVLGPFREQSQVEIAQTDSYILGVKNVPLRVSGDLKGSSAINIAGECGEVELPEGLIIAKRHLHISKEDAEKCGVTDGQIADMQTDGERGGVLGNIVIRVSNILRPTVHLDTDEGNAIGGAVIGRLTVKI